MNKFVIQDNKKYLFKFEDITEDEGGGWYSIIGHKLICIPISIKNKNRRYSEIKIEELNEEQLLLLKQQTILSTI